MDRNSHDIKRSEIANGDAFEGVELILKRYGVQVDSIALRAEANSDLILAYEQAHARGNAWDNRPLSDPANVDALPTLAGSDRWELSMILYKAYSDAAGKLQTYGEITAGRTSEQNAESQSLADYFSKTMDDIARIHDRLGLGDLKARYARTQAGTKA